MKFENGPLTPSPRTKRCAVILSILAVVALFITPFIMTFFEPEREEAISSGVFIGSIVGSVLGIIAMILNTEKKKFVYISVIPMVPLVLFLILAVPYYLFK